MAERILVLGVGNVLLKDEGAGVHALRRIESSCQFSPNVRLLDGGTLGMKLMPEFEGIDALIACDVMQDGDPPGTVRVLSWEDLQAHVSGKNSLHQVSFTETLAYAAMLGMLPPFVSVVTVEPADFSPWGTEVTHPVAAAMDAFVERILQEIARAGGSWKVKTAA
jgi:hydrogenase maturation protease